MSMLVENLYFFIKNRDVKNIQLSSTRCSLGNLGAMTPSSLCNGADDLLTHIS
jgi:hypothetical protein